MHNLYKTPIRYSYRYNESKISLKKNYKQFIPQRSSYIINLLIIKEIPHPRNNKANYLFIEQTQLNRFLGGDASFSSVSTLSLLHDEPFTRVTK